MKRIIALAVAAVALWSVAFHPWGWLYGIGVHPYPASSSTPWTYQMWSGIIPALTVLSLIGALVTGFQHVNCHVHRCWRIGRYPVADGHFKVCRFHHPDDPVREGKVTAEHVKSVHLAHMRARQ